MLDQLQFRSGGRVCVLLLERSTHNAPPSRATWGRLYESEHQVSLPPVTEVEVSDDVGDPVPDVAVEVILPNDTRRIVYSGFANDSNYDPSDYGPGEHIPARFCDARGLGWSHPLPPRPLYMLLTSSGNVEPGWDRDPSFGFRCMREVNP